jgi:hypothetical protein
MDAVSINRKRETVAILTSFPWFLSLSLDVHIGLVLAKAITRVAARLIDMHD